MVGVGVAALLVAVSVAAGAPEAPAKRLAVLEIAGEKEDVTLLKLLADAARGGSLKATDGTPYTVMTRDHIEKILEGMGECGGGGGECAVDMGRTLQADAVLAGDLVRLGEKYVLTLRVYDVRTGALKDQRQLTAADPEQLRQQVEEECSVLVNKGLGLSRQSGVGFGKGTDIRVPVLDMKAAKGRRLESINIEAEQAFEEAFDAQGSAVVAARVKAQKWCSLAAMENNNRYLETAREACTNWNRYVTNMDALERSLPDDYEKLAKFVRLKAYGKEDKGAAVDEFLTAYAAFDKSELVQNVRRSQKAVKRGDVPDLPTLGEMDKARQNDELRKQVEKAEEAAQAVEDQKRKQKVAHALTSSGPKKVLKPSFHTVAYTLAGVVQMAGVVLLLGSITGGAAGGAGAFASGMDKVFAQGALVGVFGVAGVGILLSMAMVFAPALAVFGWNSFFGDKGPVISWFEDSMSVVAIFLQMVVPIQAVDQFLLIFKGIKDVATEEPAKN